MPRCRSIQRILRRRLRLEALEPRALLAFDPAPIEQELLLYVNRMRVDPQGEFDRLIETTSPLKARDPLVDTALQFFNVSGATLRQQWNALTPVPPLAWHEALQNAAHAHNGAMIDQQAQEHQLPGEPSPGQRLTNAGYSWNSFGENIYAFAESPLYAHAGFAIDWGNGPGGIQSPPGHRNNIMNASHREAGVAIDLFDEPSVFFGPLVVTQDFASRASIGNPFVVGAVWDDANESGWYEAGEGLGGVTIEFTRAGSAAVRVTSLSAGGYQAQLAPGAWQAKAFGGALPGEIDAGTVMVSSANAMVNFIAADGAPPVAVADRATTLRNTPVTIDVKANDSDPDGSLAAATLQITVTPPGSNIAIDQGAGTITVTPPANHSGALEVQYRLRDAQGFFSSSALVTIGVVHEANAWTSPIVSRDVDFDGVIAPLDALLIINQLNAGGIGTLGERTAGEELTPFWDVSGDGSLTPLDAVEVINYLNIGGGGQAESRQIAAASAIDDDSSLLEMAAWWWLEERDARKK